MELIWYGSQNNEITDRQRGRERAQYLTSMSYLMLDPNTNPTAQLK